MERGQTGQGAQHQKSTWAKNYKNIFKRYVLEGFGRVHKMKGKAREPGPAKDKK